MLETTYKNILKSIEPYQVHLIVFFISLFIFLSFAGTRLFITDEGIILNQFYSFIHGSISLESWKINTVQGVYFVNGDKLYGKFSYSLLVLSLPVYYLLRAIDNLFSAHLFLLMLWALSGAAAAYLVSKMRGIRYAELIGAISYIILISINMPFFEPINFPKWGELLSIEFTNILISSFLVVSVYLFFKKIFGSNTGIFASFFVILATPISFYAVTLKHHSLTLLLSMLAFYFFTAFLEKKDNRYIYSAYALAGLGVWTRVLDGAVLLMALFITDMFVSRRGIRYIASVLMIILISLVPLFGFNYIITGNPFSIMEMTRSDDRSIVLEYAKEAIILGDDQGNPKATSLMKKLGYLENAEVRTDWLSVLLDISFLKSGNTFGIFLVSPFIIIALAFLVDRVKRRAKLTTIEKFFGLYTLLFILAHMDYFQIVVTHTPHVLEYRYLLIFYIIFLYFALRINKIRDAIENKIKTLAVSYCILFIVLLIYFIQAFPPPIMRLYFYWAFITSISLLMVLSVCILFTDKNAQSALFDDFMVFSIAFSFALATFFLLFYYWVVGMTFISPSQNHAVLPVLENILKWMYQAIL